MVRFFITTLLVVSMLMNYPLGAKTNDALRDILNENIEAKNEKAEKDALKKKRKQEIIDSINITIDMSDKSIEPILKDFIERKGLKATVGGYTTDTDILLTDKNNEINGENIRITPYRTIYFKDNSDILRGLSNADIVDFTSLQQYLLSNIYLNSNTNVFVPSKDSKYYAEVLDYFILQYCIATNKDVYSLSSEEYTTMKADAEELMAQCNKYTNIDSLKANLSTNRGVFVIPSSVSTDLATLLANNSYKTYVTKYTTRKHISYTVYSKFTEEEREVIQPIWDDVVNIMSNDDSLSRLGYSKSMLQSEILNVKVVD